MPYLDINPVKYRYLLAQGTHPGELKAFFTDRFKQLLLHRARLRHPPSNRTDRIACLVQKLPRSTDGVVRQWFQSHVTVEVPTPPEEVLEWFQLFDEEGAIKGLEKDDLHRLARSTLVHLFSDQPHAPLLSYLSAGGPGGRDIGSANDESSSSDVGQGDTESVESDASAEAAGSTEGDCTPAAGCGASLGVENLQVLLTAAVVGNDELLQDAATDLPSEFQTFLEGLVSARKGNPDELEHAIEALLGHAELQAGLEALRTSAGMSRGHGPQGVSILSPPWFLQQDLQFLDVLGVTTKDADSVVFVKPLAVADGTHWLRLSGEDRASLFPQSGDVLVYRRSGKRVPAVGEYVRWTVEENARAFGKTTFQMIGEPSRLYEVVRIDAVVDDPDFVRRAILDVSGRRGSIQPLLFLLADGLLLGPGAPESIREDSFEKPWLVWTNAECLLLDGRTIHVGLPLEQSRSIDLAPSDLVVKRAVRSVVEAEKITLTQRQISQLAVLVGTHELGLSDHRRRRLQRDLGRLAIDMEAAQELEALFASRPEVQRRIDDHVDREVTRRLQEKAAILAEVGSAKLRRDSLTRELKSLEKRIRDSEARAQEAVKKVIDDALADGVRTLAQAVVFSEVAGTRRTGDYRSTAGRQLAVKRCQLLLDRAGVIEVLGDVGLHRKKSMLLAAAAHACAMVGAGLIVHGSSARPVARTLSRLDAADTVYIDVPLGFTGVAEFEAAISEGAAPGALCVIDSDGSLFEHYIGCLADQIYDRVLDGVHQNRLVVMALSARTEVHALPPALKRVSLIIDVDARADDSRGVWEDRDDDEMPWLPVLTGRLRAHLDEVPEEDRALLHVLLDDNVIGFQGAG